MCKKAGQTENFMIKNETAIGENSQISHCPDKATVQNYQYRIGLILRLGGQWKKENEREEKYRYAKIILINIYIKVLLEKNSNILFPTTQKKIKCE